MAGKGYSTGFKYCSTCGEYRATDSQRCPHCGRIMRVRPRKQRNREVRYVELPVAD